MSLEYKGYTIQAPKSSCDFQVIADSLKEPHRFESVIDAIQFIDEIAEPDNMFYYLEEGCYSISKCGDYQFRCTGCPYLSLLGNGDYFCDCIGKPCKNVKICM